MYMVFLLLENYPFKGLEVVHRNSVPSLDLFCLVIMKPQRKTVVLEIQFTISDLGLAG